jgi:hexosaminidase
MNFKKINLVSGLFIISVFIISGCDTDTGYLSGTDAANDIEITWELLENDINGQNRYKAAFTLTNNGEIALGNRNWSMYFNFRHNYLYGTATGGANIRFINGNFFELSPSEEFELAPGETVTIEYEGNGRIIKNDRAPSGLYFVFTDGDENEEIALVNNYFVKPITSEQAGPDVPDAESRYLDNEHLTLLDSAELIRIVPEPLEMVVADEQVPLHETFRIVYENGLQNEAEYLGIFLLQLTGHEPDIELNQDTGPGIISLRMDSQTVNSISEEAYRLDISEGNGISIRGNGVQGVFYGIQSLLSLVPPEAFREPEESISLPAISITDSPRFPYRGMHLDVSRNFSSKETVFKLLDIMAFYKLNKLHFHLTDDEGWRLQIDGLPELTDVGAFRGHTLDDAEHLHPSYGSGPFPDPDFLYGSGYYTRDDYIDIIQYAHERHIEVIPEFDVPGHARAAKRAMDARYSRLMDEGRDEEALEFLLLDPEDQSEYRSIQNYHDNVINVCQESAYRFYEVVIDDVIAMHEEAGVPLNTIHMGGDEVPSGVWERSPACERLINENDQVDSHVDLMDYYLSRLQEIHTERDINIAGWQEIGIITDEDGEHQAKPEFAGQNMIIYSWDNFRTINLDIGNKMANAGYPVVLSNSTNLYLELAYENDPAEPGDYFAGFVSTQKVFEFKPFNFLADIDYTGDRELEPLEHGARENILGMQGHLWSEPIIGPDSLEYFYAPEILALAERAWAAQPEWEMMDDESQRESALTEDWNRFANVSGQVELPRMDYLFGGYNYRLPPPGAVIRDGVLHANSVFPGLEIRYTTDGSNPNRNSELYHDPVRVEGTVLLRTFNTNGRGSRVSVAEYP